MDVKFEQRSKAFCPIRVILLGRVTDFKRELWENVYLSIVLMLSGMMISSILARLNAFALMVVTLFGTEYVFAYLAGGKQINSVLSFLKRHPSSTMYF